MNPTAQTPTKKTRRVPLANVAFLLIGTSLMGQLLGFLRTKLVNANFPATGAHSTDAYFAAFNIPDFFFFTLAAGALGVAFMPILSDRLHKGDRKAVWELSSSLLNLLTIIMAVVAIVILVFARPLIEYVVAPKLSPEQLNNAVAIMRLLAFNPLLFTISGVLTSVQQTMGRFFFYALAPLFYNLAIIISIYVFRHNIGLRGLGIGALIGAILQLLVVIAGTTKLNFHWHPRIMWKNSEFRQILRQLPPRSLDQGIDQLESIVETNFATRLGPGSVTYYNNAYILQTAPVLLIGTAISTAAFPRLNQRLSQGRHDLFRKDFLMILRAMIWITTPVVVICFCVLTWRGMRIALRAPDSFGAYLALGLTTMVAVQAFVNISVVLGLMPTKGIPLPFISNGGSSLLINLVGMGILLNVSQQATTHENVAQAFRPVPGA